MLLLSWQQRNAYAIKGSRNTIKGSVHRDTRWAHLWLAKLLRHRFDDTILRKIRNLLRGPISLRRCFQIIAPGFAPDSSAVDHAVRGVGFGVGPGPLAFAFFAHSLTPPLATGLVRARGNDDRGDERESDFGRGSS